MEIRPDPSTGDRIPQSAADTQSAKIWPGTEGGQSQAYENVTVTEAAASHPRHLEGDPFEGFEEAIKNSEVISIKKVRPTLLYTFSPHCHAIPNIKS